LNVAAAIDILSSLGGVEILLAGGGKVDATGAAVKVTDVDSAVWDTAKLTEATSGGQTAIIKAERACMCLVKRNQTSEPGCSVDESAQTIMGSIAAIKAAASDLVEGIAGCGTLCFR
jgi:hypothetical protein